MGKNLYYLSSEGKVLYNRPYQKFYCIRFVTPACDTTGEFNKNRFKKTTDTVPSEPLVII